MWLCASLLCMTPCFFVFGASSHPYIPLHFEEMIFPLVNNSVNKNSYIHIKQNHFSIVSSSSGDSDSNSEVYW